MTLSAEQDEIPDPQDVNAPGRQTAVLQAQSPENVIQTRDLPDAREAADNTSFLR
jgi:hypothetical protein